MESCILFNEYKGMFNVQGTFLDFQSVIRKIPNESKVMIDNLKMNILILDTM